MWGVSTAGVELVTGVDICDSRALGGGPRRREAILTRVREARADLAPPEPIGRGYRREGELAPDAVVDLFAERCAAYRAGVRQVAAAELDAVDGVLTGCAVAIAETGTIALDAGPSAISDIELQRVEGVHGPRTLEVVVVV